MKKYVGLLKYELKTILKNSMSVFMLVYPLLMLFICGFLIPGILDKTADAQSNGSTVTLLIAFVLILTIGGFVLGAMLGFALIENKDENTLQNIAVTPITVSGYATFKIIYTYVISVIANFVMIGGLKLLASDSYVVVYNNVTIGLLDNITYIQILILSVVTSLFVPTIALVIAAIAKNKIEGFAFMKSSGIIIMIPMLALLNIFKDGKQYILGLAPNFWPTKALLNQALNSNEPSDISFALYLIIGAVYMLILAFISLKAFLKKAQVK